MWLTLNLTSCDPSLQWSVTVKLMGHRSWMHMGTWGWFRCCNPSHEIEQVNVGSVAWLFWQQMVINITLGNYTWYIIISYGVSCKHWSDQAKPDHQTLISFVNIYIFILLKIKVICPKKCFISFNFLLWLQRKNKKSLSFKVYLKEPNTWFLYLVEIYYAAMLLKNRHKDSKRDFI